MSVFLTKILSQIVYPLSLCLCLFMLSGILLLCGKKGGLYLLFTGIGILCLCSAPVVSSFLCASLERTFMPVSVSESPEADAIVLLGGCVGEQRYPRKTIDLSDASDRIFHAAQLYNAGKAPFIIVTGGVITWGGARKSEADTMSDLLQERDVPEWAIIKESGSLNTYQNALNTRKLIRKYEFGTILLVTSAMHMPRAVGTFRTACIDAVPSPTDYRIAERDNLNILDFLPDSGALAGTTRSIKEYLGILVYRQRGWIDKKWIR